MCYSCPRQLLIVLVFFLFSTASNDAWSETSVTFTIDGIASSFHLNIVGDLTDDRVAVAKEAVKFWADKLVSPVTIKVNMEFEPLPCTVNSATLGLAGADNIYIAFNNAPEQNLYYVSALANSYNGSDLNDSDDVDIESSFNSSIDNNDNCYKNVNWDYTVSTNSDGLSLYQTILHELAHGLGFIDYISNITGNFGPGLPSSFSYHLYSLKYQKKLADLSRLKRKASLTDTGNLVWDGKQVTSKAADVLTNGTAQSRVRIYAPKPYDQGSSVSHFDTVLFPNELMEPFSNNSISTALTEALMADIGWQIYVAPTNDEDGDGVINSDDNCINDANVDQLDTDDDNLGDICDIDDDGDGLPDNWENDQGLDPLDASDASADPDGDGLTNLEEYQIGTDINSPTIVDAEPNNSISGAQSIEGEFSKLYSNDIGDATNNTSEIIPHATVYASGDGSSDYFSFKVTSLPATAIFDIDYTVQGAYITNNLDTYILLYNTKGELLCRKDDALYSFGQEGSLAYHDDDASLDPFFIYQFADTGTYVIRVSEYDNSATPPPPPYVPPPIGVSSGSYQLQVSLSQGSSTYSIQQADNTGCDLINKAATGQPVITGNAIQGQQLTASLDVNAIDDGNGTSTTTTYSYQWLASGIEIQDATLDTLILGKAQVGKTITVRVSFTDNDGYPETLFSTPTFPVNGLATGLSNISGEATEDKELTISIAAITDGNGIDTATTYSYQWLASGIEIQDATANTLVLGQDQVGKTITVRVSFMDGDGYVETLFSSATTKVNNINDLPTGMPIIEGNPVVGSILEANIDSIADEDGIKANSFSYQWLAEGEEIKDATSSTLALKQQQLGKIITVSVSFVDLFETVESLLSQATAAIANNNAPQGTVTIMGTLFIGHTLTVDLNISDEDGLGTFTYEWYLSGDDDNILGTEVVYLLNSDEVVGRSLTVRVTYIDGNGVEELLTASSTDVIEIVWDIDGNGELNFLTDGLLFLRWLADFTDHVLINGVISTDARRTTAEEIITYMEQIKVFSDIDGDKDLSFLTDGLLLLRSLADFEGNTLINGVVGVGSTRTTAQEIQAYINKYRVN